jgi:hypothetical protein
MCNYLVLEPEDSTLVTVAGHHPELTASPSYPYNYVPSTVFSRV